MARKWTINSPTDLLLEDIDEFLCCYCLTTGRTHILDAFPAELVRLLARAPRTEQEMADAIAGQVGEEDSSEWLDSVVPVLHELQGLQLVVREQEGRG